MLSKEKLEYFKIKLLKRKNDLEEALSHVGQRNPSSPGDWDPTPADMNPMIADKNEMADVFEELENRKAIEDKLEERLVFVNEALERIEKGAYGLCQKCGEPIPEERLEAFPSAKNCVEHARNYK